MPGPRLHPCLCGFTAETYGRMTYHRKCCDVWKARPDPKDLMLARQAASRPPTTPSASACAHCGKRPDHHAPDCPDSLGESARREALERHAIDPDAFGRLLAVLSKRYG